MKHQLVITRDYVKALRLRFLALSYLPSASAEFGHFQIGGGVDLPFFVGNFIGNFVGMKAVSEV